MTRAKQKDAERALLQHALSRLGTAYTFIECGERPDFIIDVDGRRIGAEVTEYHSDRCSKALEQEWSRISDELDKVRQDQRSRFVNELVEFVRNMAAQIGTDYLYVQPDSKGWPLLSNYVCLIRLRKTKSYIHWECSNLEFGSVGSGEEEWLRILDVKLSSNFERDVAEYWLFVVGGHSLSQVMGNLFVDRMKNFDRLSNAFRGSQYNAIFFCQWKIVRWSRAFGWKVLIGEIV